MTAIDIDLQVKAIQGLCCHTYLSGPTLGQFLCSWPLSGYGRNSNRPLQSVSPRSQQPRHPDPRGDSSIFVSGDQGGLALFYGITRRWCVQPHVGSPRRQIRPSHSVYLLLSRFWALLRLGSKGYLVR